MDDLTSLRVMPSIAMKRRGSEACAMLDGGVNLARPSDYILHETKKSCYVTSREEIKKWGTDMSVSDSRSGLNLHDAGFHYEI